MHVSIDQAQQLLKNGNVVAVPTETVYGLAASINHQDAIAHIFSLKNRPANNPLIVHVADVDQIFPFMDATPPQFHELAATFWPGPLTIVIPVQTAKIPEMVRAGLATAAFRVPSHPLTQQLLTVTGPLVMPSANLSGTPSATLASHVEHDFGQNFPVIDGGECTSGVESTIVIYQKGFWQIIRLGAIPPEAFTSLLNYEPEVISPKEGTAPLCPGQLYRHYAPQAQLILTSQPLPEFTKGVIIGFADRHYPVSYRLIPLSLSDAPEEAAHNLYAVLRQLDEESISSAFIDMNFPDNGLWRTLRERILKAKG